MSMSHGSLILERTMSVLENSEGPFFPPGAAIVIGGSGGIGAAIAVGLARHGSDVAITYRKNEEAAMSVAAEIERCGRKAHAGGLDIGVMSQVQTFMDETSRRFERIHTLIVATGADINMPYVSEIGADDWEDVIRSDLTGFYNCARSLLPLLKKGGGGSIVAITSAGLVRHPPRDILSTVPKAGVEALIRGIAREEGRFGIRANSVALGVFDTGLFRRVSNRLEDGHVAAMKRNIALRRFGTAEEAAHAAIFLASSRASFITGHRLVIDGGYSI